MQYIFAPINGQFSSFAAEDEKMTFITTQHIPKKQGSILSNLGFKPKNQKRPKQLFISIIFLY